MDMNHETRKETETSLFVYFYTKTSLMLMDHVSMKKCYQSSFISHMPSQWTQKQDFGLVIEKHSKNKVKNQEEENIKKVNLVSEIKKALEKKNVHIKLAWII